MENIIDLIDIQSCHAQGSLDWFRDRLGCITSSNVSCLMGITKEAKDLEKLKQSPLKRGETPEQREQTISDLEKYSAENPLTDTAKSYLRKIAAERNLQKRYIEDDTLFQEYLDRIAINTRSIRYGSENEAIAREIYRKREGVEIAECGFIRHKEIDMYGDSPDGIVLRDGVPFRAIEIKFPNPDTWMKYAESIHDAESLKEVMPEYYWQCMSHIECCRAYFGCEDCDFIFCDKMQKGGYRRINIKPNEEDIAFMKSRIIAGNKYIETLLSNIKNEN